MYNNVQLQHGYVTYKDFVCIALATPERAASHLHFEFTLIGVRYLDLLSRWLLGGFACRHVVDIGDMLLCCYNELCWMSDKHTNVKIMTSEVGLS